MHFSFSKAYVFTMIPLALVGVGVMIFVRKTNSQGSLDEIIKNAIRFFSEHQSQIPIFGFVIGLILLTVSAFIASMIYRKKEL